MDRRRGPTTADVVPEQAARGFTLRIDDTGYPLLVEAIQVLAPTRCPQRAVHRLRDCLLTRAVADESGEDDGVDPEKRSGG